MIQLTGGVNYYWIITFQFVPHSYISKDFELKDYFTLHFWHLKASVLIEKTENVSFPWRKETDMGLEKKNMRVSKSWQRFYLRTVTLTCVCVSVCLWHVGSGCANTSTAILLCCFERSTWHAQEEVKISEAFLSFSHVLSNQTLKWSLSEDKRVASLSWQRFSPVLTCWKDSLPSVKPSTMVILRCKLSVNKYWTLMS